MSDPTHGGDSNRPPLNLTPDEKRVFGQLFAQADTEKIGIVTGDVAVKFFERTHLTGEVLGEIWQIADTENNGFLNSSGFCMVLRLIGHFQAGRYPELKLAYEPGPLPKFEGFNLPPGPSAPPGPPPNIQPQLSGPIRVPPLSPDKATEYASLFEKSGAQNGILPGDLAKSIFEKARLSTDILGRIWNLADTEQRGALGVTEFIIAMHLLASYKSGAMKALPNTLPAGLYEAASRRIPPPPGRMSSGPRAGEPVRQQFSGAGGRPQSPLSRGARPPYGTPPQSAQATGNDWLVSPQEKASYDNLFNKVDTSGRGYITGDQGVMFFSDSGLPEEVLASIWDLADINKEGRLSRDEFAVAMYLIRQQRPNPGVGLPATLPPNLVPPSMRHVPRASGTTAPAFDNAAYSSGMSKSASEDLFGLDAFSDAPPAATKNVPAPVQTQQSTGGSASYSRQFDSDPFANKSVSPSSPTSFQPQPRNPASTFKPFTPSSAFGQGLASHGTGGSGSSAQASTRGPQPDLLGDNDPEVSKKLTQETTELANMSNQIGTLRNQMQDVQTKKSATEGELSAASGQKRDLELRLSQFRSQYEHEVKIVKSLEEQLAAHRNETKKIQQDLAIVEGTYQDLQTQHRQVGTALEADQRENASLKERISQINAEISQLKPQLEKMKADARHQKGMTAINKKQLATVEGQRDRLQAEMDELAKAAAEARRSPQPPPPEQSSNVVSPAASTASQSTNPFFRRSPSATVDNTMSPSGFHMDSSQDHGHRKDFDNVFGPQPTSQSTPPPQTSFRSETQPPQFSVPSVTSVSSQGPDVPTPSTSPPLSQYQESSPRGFEQSASQESRQFNPNLQPLRENLPRADSYSSANVSSPTNPYSATGQETPTAIASSPSATPVQAATSSKASESPKMSRAETGQFGSHMFDRTASPAASASSDPRSGSRTEDRYDAFQSFQPSTAHRDIPGAFPGDTNSPLQPEPTGGSAMSDGSKGRSDPFAMSRDQPRGSGSTKHDFDSAFANFGPRGVQDKQNTGSDVNGSVDAGASNKFNQEFPPIEDLRRDEDSDSNSEPGFEDNFTTASPQQRKPESPNQSFNFGPPSSRPTTTEGGSDVFGARPTITQVASSGSEHPAPGAQKPPIYEQSQVGGKSSPRGSNSFPSEFGGLLPSRQDPTQQGSQSPEKTFSSPVTGSQSKSMFGGPIASSMGPSSGASPPPLDTPASTAPSDAYHSAMSYPSGMDKGPSPPSQMQQQKQATFGDEFDSGFDDLTDAKEAEDKTDEEFGSYHREGLDEFNPVFDSPANSKSNTMASQNTMTGRPDQTFGDFDHMSHSEISQGKAPQQPTATTSHDWDAIFSGLNTSSQQDTGASPFPEASTSAAKVQERDPEPPQLGRALSAGTEHDDPILKQVTSMGYRRSDALSALEKYDYDINKVSNNAVEHLSSGR